MSTAGKVLVVLVTLSLMAWIVLFSAAAQLNTNHGKKIQDLEKQAADLAEAKDKAEVKLEQTKIETNLKQRQTELALVALRTRDSDAQRSLSVISETNTRYKLDLATVTAQAEEAKAAQDRRERDVAGEKKQLADVQGEVSRVRAENRLLLDRYAGLQKDYAETAAKNRDLATKVVHQAATSAASR